MDELTSYLRTNSPYVLAQQVGQQKVDWGGGRALAQLMFHFIGEPLTGDPYWASDVGILLWNYRSHVICEFMRLYVDKRISAMKFPRNFSREGKDLVKANATLYGEVWKLIGELYRASILAPGAGEALTFGALIQESKLVSPFVICLGDGDRATTTYLVKAVQAENRRLQKLENPISRLDYPETWQFVESAHGMSGRNDDFRKSYMSMVEARMHLTAIVRKSSPELTTSQPRKTEKRGRKSKGGSRTPAP